jgi:hypothetical protein
MMLVPLKEAEQSPPPYQPPGEPIEAPTTRFKLERWSEIAFELDEEFLIDGIMPREGVGLVYGASQTLKSFIATHMGLSVARGTPWAGRQTKQASVVYLAAEGASGLRKRKAGYVKAGRAPADGVDFALLSAAPNLGTATGDYQGLVRTIEDAGIKPGLIIVDTIAKVIGGADENGAGMAQFLVNAEALAQHFGCFVLAVHHIGWDEGAKDRPRGWSGLPPALDVQILSERTAGELSATLTIQKLKDEPSGIRFVARLERFVLGVSKSGREVSTLIVDGVEEVGAQTSTTARARTPKSARLLMAAIAEALDSHGTDIRPFGDEGPIVRAVAERHVRDIYFKRVAEKEDPDEDPDKLYDRQRVSFKRAIKGRIDTQDLVAADYREERFLWPP